MQKGVIISHRGAVYEIGRAPGYYGIWLVAAGQAQPGEWWPETPDGWYSAWMRFTSLESPDAIKPAGPGTAGPGKAWPGTAGPGGATSAGATTAITPPPSAAGRLIAPVLIGAGLLFGIVGLFLSYVGGTALASHPAADLLPHLFYLVAWMAAAVLLLRPGTLPRVGALIGLGTSAVSFGLFFADLGEVISGAKAGVGLWLSLVGWAVCAGGSIAGLLLWRGSGAPSRPRSREAVLLVVLATLAGLGAAAAFAPSWDSYTLRTPSGVLQSFTAGNAFANPGAVIFGNVAAMVLLAAVVIIAALWRPVIQGAALLAGAIVPMLAQGISALTELSSKVSPADLGISQQAANRLGLTISSGLTPAFWVFAAFVIALILICARMLTTAESAQPTSQTPVSYDAPPTSVSVS